jgi:cytochrome c biogenesis protein CcmG/thiol:disulfide interchange protein DsbE
MQNQNSIKTTGKLLTLLVTVAFLLSACSGGSLPQPETAQLNAQMGAQLQAKQSLPGQEPAKQAQPDQQSAQPPAGGQLPASGQLPAAAEPAVSQPAAALAQPAPEQLAAPVDAAPKVAPAVDLSIPVEPKIGSRAPDFALQTLNGETIRLSEMVGRPVVISYWATWCNPCKKELPVLDQLSQEYRSQGLVVVTVNAIEQDSREEVQAMVGETSMTLPVLLDQGNQFASTYGALFFPTTIFVDASGVIRFIRLGDSSEADLRSKVENLLAGSL